MCTGRIDLSFIFRAFSNGMDGVFVGGCRPGECHYLTEGNYLAYSTVSIARKLMRFVGIKPDRLGLEWISAAEGNRFADLMNDFSKMVKSMGPLNDDVDMYESRLEAVNRMIPYIKLVERERLRVPVRTEKAYENFYKSKEFDGLFRELIEEKLYISEISTLLSIKSRSSIEIAEAMKLSPSEVSRFLSSLSRHGLIDYNIKDGVFTVAGNIRSSIR